jgi:DNA-binding NarL/FixJ family response regulator
LKKILSDDFEIILCDMVMPNFPGDMFYLAVERVRPNLCKRFIFMTGHKGDPKIGEFIRRIRGLMLWKPFEMHVLFDAIKAVNSKKQ